MATLRIPVPASTPAFHERVVLDQVEYGFSMRWNQRAERWYFELSDSTGALIASRMVTPNWPLLAGIVRAGRPGGELFAVDSQELGTPIGFDDWGSRVVLNYVEAADLAALMG